MDDQQGDGPVLYDEFHRQMAGLIREDQQAGRIPGELDPDGTALALVALAEGLATALGPRRR